MLKRIAVSNVELGMFVHKLEGSWFKHPFWKSRFLLQDEAMLGDLQASDIEIVVIDISKGHDVRRPARVPGEASPFQTNSQLARRPAVNRLIPSRVRIAPRPQPRTLGFAPPQQPDLRSTAPNSIGREFGLIEQLRAGNRHHNRPILVLTTESSDEKKQRARNAGATGWIVKPFDPEKLATAVRRVAH